MDNQEQITQALLSICNQGEGSGFYAEDILEAIYENPNHPLRKHIKLDDDAEAAHKYRLIVLHHWIRESKDPRTGRVAFALRSSALEDYAFLEVPQWLLQQELG